MTGLRAKQAVNWALVLLPVSDDGTLPLPDDQCCFTAVLTPIHNTSIAALYAQLSQAVLSLSAHIECSPDDPTVQRLMKRESVDA